MDSNFKNKIRVVDGDVINIDKKEKNKQFKKMIKNKPDFKKMEPIEIYNWMKNIVDLTKS